MSRCLLCGVAIQKEYCFSNLLQIKKDVWCEKCKRQLVLVKGGCLQCGKDTIHDVCEGCLEWNEAMGITIKNHSLYYYNSFAKEIINKIKFNGNRTVLKSFSDVIRAYCKTHFRDDYVVIPVPLHEERLKERGFNQSLTIARMMNISVYDILAKRIHDKQSKKRKEDRKQLKDHYVLKGNIPPNVKNLIIVDDIYTTGATIYHIGLLLSLLNVKNIVSFTLFRS